MADIDDVEIPENMKVPDVTRKWLQAWKDDPITDGWTKAQCQYLLDTALVHAAIWGMGRFDLASELRARETQMGVEFTKKRKASEKGDVLRMVVLDRAKKKAANG